MTSQDPAIVLDLIEAFRRSKTMFTSVSLGVFDQLSTGPMAAVELAPVLKCNVDALGRLLDGCVGLALLQRDGERYAIADVAKKYLVSSSPDTLAGYVIYSDRSLYKLWSNLEDAVREGTNRWEQTFGSRESLFAHFFQSEESTRNFLGGMHGFGQIASSRIVERFDLSRFRRMVDLGGATGHLCMAACERYPQLRATVFDLPQVERFANEHLASSSARERLHFTAGDFFSDELPEADLYTLGRILHDWDEVKIRRLLDKVHASLPPGGALLVVEALLDDDHSGPAYALMQSLNMLICTDGKERSCPEYRALLQQAGFESVECRRTGVLVDAVLARKAGANATRSAT